MDGTRHRRLIVLRGAATETAADARRLVRRLPPSGVLWVSADDAPEQVTASAPGRVKVLLGRGFDAVVLCLHEALDPEVLGQCQGFVWGGGALVLRMSAGTRPTAGHERLTVFPHDASEVGDRLFDRFERCLARAAHVEEERLLSPLTPPDHDVVGTTEQRAVVDSLCRLFVGDVPGLAAVLADRGRGKSSALGLAIAEAANTRPASAPLRIGVTAAHRSSADEIFRFAKGLAGPPPAFMAPTDLLAAPAALDVLVVDEAAQLPVPLLRRLVAHFETARIAFATTTRGYEGTGRGFVLRFLAELDASHRPLEVFTLEEPMRWSSGDPVERFVFDALALDAAPAPLETLGEGFDAREAEHQILDRGALAENETMLRDFFGILVHAHYRTTPSDLHRMLDAPNVRLHALVASGRVIAASLIALEGGLPEEIRTSLYWGRQRLRGHSLPETLICHSGESEAGSFSFVRSLRIAVHPALRRLGLATRLVEEVHLSYEPDFFGTIFGATPELLRFRRSVGYELVRVGASRGVRTGEPAAVMLRPMTERARQVMSRLRGVLARDLPVFEAHADAEPGFALEPSLTLSLGHALPAPAPLHEADIERIAQAYAHGPRTYETAATALAALVAKKRAAIADLDPRHRTLLEARVVERRPWRAVAERAGYETVPAAMRAMRRAVADLLGDG